MSTTLTATVASTTSTVVLESCKLQDSRIVDTGAYFRRSRDHSIYGYKRAIIESLTLDFGDMNRTKIEELQTWLNFSAGYIVTLTLDNGNVWTGKVMNDPFESTHQSQRNSTFTLTFEGTPSA